MKIHELAPTAGSKKDRRRVGRGNGSGLGGTCGRGDKGQQSRSGATLRHHFEGGQTPSFRRIPKRGFTNGVKEIFNVVNVGLLAKTFKAGDEVNENTLRLAGILGKAKARLKILGEGEITIALKVTANFFSASAREKIEKAGGSVSVIEVKKAEEAKA